MTPEGRSLPNAGVPASAELLRQVRRVEMRTRRLVNSRFSGEYLSTFKGQGIEFAEVREYLPGDDIRAIDWNVTARLGKPFVKRYIEERELSVLMIADLSGSDRWGTRGKLKSWLLTEVVATLAMSAVRNNDRVGLLVVTDRVERFLPPRKGRRHVLRMIRDLLSFKADHSTTNLTSAMDYARRVLAHRSLVFVFSDFQLGDGWDAFGNAISGLRARHDVVACHLVDPSDRELPDVGMLRTVDPETGEVVFLDTTSPEVRERHAALAARDEGEAQRLFHRVGIDEIRLRTDESFASALISFFRRRERRRR
ncbi:MAG: DUF58 domain-containing protein [Gemmatimonadota bacterium]|jgi:uncharacterized protein (DUF58 family)|nr:DUF58 domain-containing protein [Gemmatimonadota bacterium]